MSKRAAVALAAVLWLLEWVFGWSQHLGKLGDLISTAWLALFAYFVFESRLWRIPRAVHTWMWMIALLVVSVVRAWWLGGSDELGFFKGLAEQFPQSRHHLTHEDVAILDAFFDVMLVGAAVGIAGAVEGAIIALTSWIADGFRKGREPARVDLLLRIIVVALQAPIFLVVMGTGFAAIGGATVLATHELPGTASDLRSYVPWIAGYGLAAWAFATFHLGRLFALARGSRINRTLLALIGIAAAVTVVALGAHGVRAIAGLVIWVAMQLLALRFATPTSTPAPAVPRSVR
jgi:hypothetical protein